MMDLNTAKSLGESAMDRDPRNASCGYFAGGSFVLDSVRVFQWFNSIEDMAVQLLECEPILYEISAEDFVLYRDRASFLLNGITVNDLSQERRDELNNISERFLSIDWWGTFSDLFSGDSEFARDLRIEFREDSEAADERAITEPEMDDFVSFIHQYGY